MDPTLPIPPVKNPADDKIVIQQIHMITRRLFSQRDHAHFGYPTNESILAQLRRMPEVKITRSGALRLFDGDEFIAAIKARAKAPTRKAAAVVDDDAALEAAGLRRKASR